MAVRLDFKRKSPGQQTAHDTNLPHIALKSNLARKQRSDEKTRSGFAAGWKFHQSSYSITAPSPARKSGQSCQSGNTAWTWHYLKKYFII